LAFEASPVIFLIFQKFAIFTLSLFHHIIYPLVEMSLKLFEVSLLKFYMAIEFNKWDDFLQLKKFNSLSHQLWGAFWWVNIQPCISIVLLDILGDQWFTFPTYNDPKSILANLSSLPRLSYRLVKLAWWIAFDNFILWALLCLLHIIFGLLFFFDNSYLFYWVLWLTSLLNHSLNSIVISNQYQASFSKYH